MRRKGLIPLVIFVGFTLATLAWTFLAGNSPVLTFTHADNQYQLIGIWDSTTEGRALPRR